MTNYGTEVLRWEVNKLFFKEELKAEIVPEDHYGTIMFRIHFPDGTKTKDVYNKTWAKENAMKEAMKTIRIPG